MRIRNNSYKQRGFTLIEIVAAFVVFALLFATVLKVITVSIRSTMRSSAYTQVALWAQSRLDAVGVESVLEERYETGEFNQDYRWELRISPYEFEWTDDTVTTEVYSIAEIPIELMLVELTVYWNDNQREAAFTTLRSRRKEI